MGFDLLQQRQAHKIGIATPIDLEILSNTIACPLSSGRIRVDSIKRYMLNMGYTPLQVYIVMRWYLHNSLKNLGIDCQDSTEVVHGAG
jgi:hypothetical protein